MLCLLRTYLIFCQFDNATYTPIVNFTNESIYQSIECCGRMVNLAPDLAHQIKYVVAESSQCGFESWSRKLTLSETLLFQLLTNFMS